MEPQPGGLESPLLDWHHGDHSPPSPLLNGRHSDHSPPSPLPSRNAASNTSQLALVGAQVCPIESLDYEVFENELFNQDWRSRSRAQIFEFVVMKWALCFLVGLLTGLVGFLNNISVENLAGVKFVITSNLMLSGKFLNAFGVFTSINLGLTLFASLITIYIAPAAAGSGIPEVKAYLNGVDAPGILAFKTLIVNIIGSIIAVSASLRVGKAGPMLHTGACIAALVGQGGSERFKMKVKILGYFQNDRERRDLVTCGAAAGIAAAFRAPLGGLLFALEEVASWWRSALLWRVFFTTAVVAVVLRAFIILCNSGKCGLFGKGGLIMYKVTPSTISYELADLPSVVVLGIIGGVLGSIYNFLLSKSIRVHTYLNEKGNAYKLFIACSISVLTSCCMFGLPWLATCRPCPPDAREECPTIGRSGNFKKYQCPTGHYNDLASLFFNTNDDAIRNLFTSGTNEEFQSLSVFIFLITSYFLTVISFSIVLPAGLFIPIILTGASYGRFLGILMGKYSTLDHGLFAVLGAASFLAGTMRSTVSLCVILVELTNDLMLLPLVMLVLLISKTVADIFNCNVYDIIVKLKGFPYLEAHAEPYMRQLTVGDVITGPLQYFNGIEKVSTIVQVLQSSAHNGFPVIDEPPSDSPIIYGLVLRAHLLVLLKKRKFLSSGTANGIDASMGFSANDFEKKVTGKKVHIEDIELTSQELDMFIDLHPFSNTSPYTVGETMSLAKALKLFRDVGLRHMLVVPNASSRFPVLGILTRHDFMPEHIFTLHSTLRQSRWKKLHFFPV